MNPGNLQLNEKPSVLIAEDNVTNMLLVKCIFENILPNAILWEAENGLDAINLYQSVSPDIILMDIRMPVKNGYEATEEIRKLDTTRKTPIIALTAGTQGERERCLESGMDDYISKPIIQDSIEVAVRKWLPLLGSELIKNSDRPVQNQIEEKVHFDEEELRNRLKNRENLVRRILQESKKGLDECHQKMNQQCAEKDFSSLMQTAHKLKGMALSSCFNHLVKLVSELEELNGVQPQEINDKIHAINTEIMLIKSLIQS